MLASEQTLSELALPELELRAVARRVALPALIAGGAIAGIIIAFMAGALERTDAAITHWAEASNPFFAGTNSDWLALLPFAALWSAKENTRLSWQESSIARETVIRLPAN